MENVARPTNKCNPGVAPQNERSQPSAFTLVGVASADRLLCKEITPGGSTQIGNLPYVVHFETQGFADVTELYEILDELRVRTDVCVVRAEPIPGHPVPCRRLLHGDDVTGHPATLREVPRDWLMLDFDSVDTPDGLDFTRHPAPCAEHLRSLLPPEFRGAKAVWRASSNAGLKPGIRAHLWLRVDRPLLGEQLREWLKDAPIDRTPFRAVQPHFTADPIFNGVSDPMAARIGLLDGAEVVQVPDAIVNYAPAPALALPISNVDPLMRSALTKWAAANAPRLAEYAPGSSTRYPCPVCGSSDGLAVRADGRFNCHGNKHDAPPHDSIGTNTGNVYVGHPVEFLERIPRGTLRKWLTERYPECFTFGLRLGAKVRDANTSKSEIVPCAPVDALDATGENTPTVRELERAVGELKKAASVVRGNPAVLAEVAAQIGRYVPLFLAYDQVHETLLNAALESDTAFVVRPDAEVTITEGIARGMQVPRVARRNLTGFGLKYDEHGRPLNCYPNVLALVSAPELAECVAFNERKLSVFVVAPPPWHEDDSRRFPREIDDADYSLICALLSDRFDYSHASPNVVATAIEAVARGNLWDPVRSYFDSLKWTESLDDARELLGTAAVEVLGCTDTPYSRAAFMRWMIAAVQRTYEPGCVQREVLTLVGPQNIGKSTVFTALCPDPTWFTDTCDADGSKDSREVLLGKLIIELSEVDKHIKEERSGAFKNFLSGRADAFRRAYARAAGDYPRRCVFAATTNEEQPFRDRTGNTRFNVVRVTRADHKFVADARDELWAAAVALYRDGEKSWLQGDERVEAGMRQAEGLGVSTGEALLGELLEKTFTQHKDGDVWPTDLKLTLATRYGGSNRDPVRELLGFTPDAEQIDSDGKLRLLSLENLSGYLRAKGERLTNQLIRAALKQRGWVQGRTARSDLGAWGNRQCTWARNRELITGASE